jgi:hypothetical protein
MLIALGAGIAVGLIHVLSGPDHLAAIAPLASVERQRVWAIGLRWGLGHALGVVLVGLLVGVLTQWVFVDPVSAASERLVGVMLLAVAGLGFWRFFRPSGVKHSHQAQSADFQHTHAHHAHAHDTVPLPFISLSKTSKSPNSSPIPRPSLVPYAIGVLHGCAGGSHFLGILLALAFPTFAGVLTYLAGFVVGTLFAMTAFAAGIGWLASMGRLSPRFQSSLVLISSGGSAVIGGYWLFA